MFFNSFIAFLGIAVLSHGKTRLPPLPISTFSIIARDQKTGELGIAVQSKFIAVGGVVPYASAGVGAIASQAWGNVLYGPRGIDLLSSGKNPNEVIEILTSADPFRNRRQLAVIGLEGNASNYTGTECLDWAGAKIGEHFSVQGNLLAGPQVIAAMASNFRESKGFLSERLIKALEAGQFAGGDKRGRQSAALLVVRSNWGYGGLNDRFRDLRVDDHPRPIEELYRIYKIHRKTFPRPDERLDSEN